MSGTAVVEVGLLVVLMVRCTVACSRTHPVTTVAGCGCCVALALHIRVVCCSGMGRGPDGPLHAFFARVQLHS